MGATLPLPDVLISSKLTIANQVGTAITFMIEFTGTLIENELEELIIVGKVACPYIRSIRAFTKLVNPIDSTLLAGSNHGWICSITTTSPVIPVTTSTNHALGIHQIDICQTEEREIGFYTCISSIRCSGFIILQVAPLL